jgi:hypothetical protein
MQDLFDVFKNAFVTAYDGEDDPETPVVSDDVDPSVTPADDPAKTKTPRTFTQEDVNKIVQQRLAKEREAQAKEQEKNKELITKLQELEKRADLTKEERDALNIRLEELRSEKLSKEGQLARELDTLKQENERIAREKEEVETTWKTRYNNFRIEKELADAAIAHDARTPDQLVKLLKESTRIDQEIDKVTNKPTGNLIVKTRITDFDEDNQPFEVELTPREAVARLREMPEIWGNQFMSKAQPGIDVMTAQKGIVATAANTGLVIGKGYKAYKESREKNAEVLGIRKRPERS